MSTIEHVGQQLNAGIKTLPFDALNAAQRPLDEVSTALLRLNIDLSTAEACLMALRTAKNAIANTEDLLYAGRNNIAAYMAEIGLKPVVAVHPSADIFVDTPVESWGILLTGMDKAVTNEQTANIQLRAIGKVVADPRCDEKIKEGFLAIGLDYDDMKQAWSHGLSRDSREIFNPSTYRGENVKRILSLEAEHPGVARQITETFGIKNFARLGPITLECLRKALEKPPDEYTLFVMAEADENGALISGGNDLEQALASLPEGTAPIIPVELNGITGAHVIKRKLLKRGWGQAEDAVIAAHGRTNMLTLSHADNPRSAPDHTGHLRPIASLLHGVVKEGGVYRLISCSTGAGEDNIAQYIANKSNRTAYAPPERVCAQFVAAANPDTGKTEVDIRFTDRQNVNPVEALRFDPR